MSRGHGAAQRFVLAELGERLGIGQTLGNLAWSWMHHKAACGCTDFTRCGCPPNENELESIRRAVRSLQREGLVQTHWEGGTAGPYKVAVLSADGIKGTLLSGS